MSSDQQALFLMEEYKNINASISLNNTNVNAGFRLLFGFLAAGVGALMLGITKDIDVRTLVIFFSVFSSFLFVFTFFSSVLLVQERIGYRKRLQALNSIRSYFVSICSEKKEYFVLPTTTDPVRLRRLSSSPAVWFMVGFSTILLALTVSSCLYLYSDSVLIILFVSVFATICTIVLHWLIFKTSERAYAT